MASSTGSAVSATVLGKPDYPPAQKEATDVEADRPVSKETTQDNKDVVEDDSVKSVGYWSMFRYATPRQWTLTIVGLVLSWFNGASLPAFALLFGKCVGLHLIAM
jgi:hypothetical protein